MKRVLYGFACLAMITSIQGCFWHSTTEKDVVPAGTSSTTVVQPGATTTTTQ